MKRKVHPAVSAHMASIGREGGKAITTAKAKAARENGKKRKSGRHIPRRRTDAD